MRDAGVRDREVQAALGVAKRSPAAGRPTRVRDVAGSVAWAPGSTAASSESSSSERAARPRVAPRRGQALGERAPDPAGRTGEQARVPEPISHRARSHRARYDRRMSSEHATVAEEEYLQTLFWLHEAGLPMTGANVARAMQLSAPTVHEMIGRLERDGYIMRAADKAISFTDDRARARRGHRPPPPADRALPDRRARASPGTRSTRRPSASSTRCRPCSRSGCSPRSATPRPARTATRSTPARGSRASRSPTSRRARRSRILRFENEAEDLLHYLRGAGLEPGMRGHARCARRRRGRRRAPTAATCAVTRSVAETVSVMADPSPPPRVALPEQLVFAARRYGR